MSTTSSTSASLALSGLASGIDWTSIVNELTTIEAAPETQMNAEISTDQQKSAAYSAIGTQLTPAQLTQLTDQPGRSVYIAFDQDENQAGQRASQQLTLRLQHAGIRARIVQLPHGHDPNSYFVAGASAADFTACLREASRP